MGLVAEALGLPRSRVAVVEGATHRLKVLQAAGDGPALAGRLEALIRP